MINQSPATSARRLSHGELLEMKRWNTPTIYNGWEQVTRHNASADAFNLEETRDFMPQMGPMVGYAVTVVYEPGNPEHARRNPKARDEYRAYVASEPGPKIVIVQDLDKPRCFGTPWGEANGNLHRALGCVGTIIDGAIRDYDEMVNAGFKAIARRLCVGHAKSIPVRWNCEVEVFGRRIQPGQLVHADKHGFLAIPFGEEERVLEAARYLDTIECHTTIAASRGAIGLEPGKILERLAKASEEYRSRVKEQFTRKGEW